MIKPLPRKRFAFPLSLLLSTAALSSAHAQSSPTGSTAASDAASSEIIELSPFEVRSDTRGGYGATESTTGSRVATKIIDLPYTVNVLNSEFFEDFALFELNDNVAYISSFTDLDQGGSFNLRGFRSTVQLRDGFFRLGRYGSSNIDRIEIIKGPNAAIYGQTSPGGMVNMISKKPKSRNSYKLSLNTGSFDTVRGTLEANQVFGPNGRTKVLAVMGYYDRGSDTPLEEANTREGYLAIQHDFSKKSNFLFQAEYMTKTQEAGGTSAPLILNDNGTTTNTDDKIVGIAKGLDGLQQRGPFSYLTRNIKSFTGTYTNRLTQNLNFRVSGNYYHAENENFNQNVTTGQVNPRTLVMTRGAAPEYGAIFEDGGGVQADLLGTYFIGKVENRTLFTLEFNDYYRDDPAAQIGGAQLAGWTPIRSFRVLPDLSGPDGEIPYLNSDLDLSTAILRRDNKNRNSIWGTLVRHQASFWNSRLMLFGGARLDYVIYRLRDRQNNRQNRFTFTEVTPNLGASFKVVPGWHAFVNYSEGFFPNTQSITAAQVASNYDSERAQGLEYGFKGAFMEERLTFTLNAYRIERQNVRVDDIDPVTGLQVVNFEGSQLVRGVELDTSWEITDDLTTGFSLGYVDAQITDLGLKTASVGRSPARISPYNGGAYLRYRPRSGVLNGFSGNVGVTYFSSTPVSNPDAGDTYTNGVLVRSTEEWKIKVPGTAVVNAGIRYRFNADSKRRLSHTIGVNVNNALDSYYLKSSRGLGDRRSFFFNYTVQY